MKDLVVPLGLVTDIHLFGKGTKTTLLSVWALFCMLLASERTLKATLNAHTFWSLKFQLWLDNHL